MKLPPKRAVFDRILADFSPTVLLYVDHQHPDVALPAHLMSKKDVVLQVGWDMVTPIRDMVADDQGFRGWLSFGGQPFYCVVPWKRVFVMAAEDGQAFAWTADMPKHFQDELISRAADQTAKQEAAPLAEVISLEEYRQRKLQGAKKPPRAS